MRLLLALLSAASAFAQVSHVAWTVTPEATDGGKLLLRAAGKIDPGWHLYSASSPAGIPTSFQVASAAVRVFQPAPVRAFDKNFGTDTETFEGEVAFLVETTGATLPAEVKIRYQTCNDTQCVPSRFTGTVAGPAPAASIAIP